MLVLNRRPGESIIIERDISVRVDSASDRKAWLCVEAPGVDTPVRLAASVVAEDEVRFEVGAPASVSFDADGVRVEVGDASHPASAAQATIALNLRAGQSVAIGDGLRVGIGPMNRSNPCVSLEGPLMGSDVRITVIRQVGSYVRLGVDAPGRRVYRKELWDEVVGANQAAAGEDLSALLGTAPAGTSTPPP